MKKKAEKSYYPPTVRISVNIPTGLMDEVLALAQSNEMSSQEALRWTIREGVKAMKTSTPTRINSVEEMR